MRASSLLALSAGWLLTSLGVAFDVGVDDLIFTPSLALGMPALVGLVVGLRAHRQGPPQALRRARLIGFAALGVLIAMLAVLGLIAAFYWAEPVPVG